MEDNLRKLLHEKLEALPPKEAFPDFSKEGTWNELSARLGPEQKKSRPFVGWWSYAAAALIAGLIIGGLSIKYMQQSDRTLGRTASTVVTSIPDNAPHQQQRPPAGQPAAPHPFTNSARPKVLIPAQQVHNSRAIVQTNNSESTAPHRIQKERLQQPAELLAYTPAAAPPEASAQPKERQRAIHLLDVESEDKTVLINESRKTYSQPAFTIYISPSRLPSGRDAQSPASVMAPIIR